MEGITENSITENGITKEVRVEKVENGYIVQVSKSGDTKDGWKHSSKKWISATNPLEKKSSDPTEEPFGTKEDVWDAIDTLT